MADMENSDCMIPLDIGQDLTWVADQPMVMFGGEGLYTGQCIKFTYLKQGTVPFGIGRFVKKSGAIYEGQFDSGKPQGFMRWIGQSFTRELCTIGQLKDGQIMKYKTFHVDGELAYESAKMKTGKLAGHEQEFSGQYQVYQRIKQITG